MIWYAGSECLVCGDPIREDNDCGLCRDCEFDLIVNGEEAQEPMNVCPACALEHDGHRSVCDSCELWLIETLFCGDAPEGVYACRHCGNDTANPQEVCNDCWALDIGAFVR